jgi:hypothetical protein
VVLDQPNKFIRTRLKLRFASGMVADRRPQLAFWDSSTSTGYLSYARAGTSTLTANTQRQSAIPALGIMNAGGTILTTTGDRTVSLGTSQTVVRDATLLIYPRADNTIAIRVTSGAPAGTNVRGVLAFPTVTLAATGDFLSISFDLRFTNTLAADRRFQTAFYSSASNSGYIGQMKAGTATGNSTFFDQPAMPATGVMNAGGTALTATGAITNALTAGNAASLPIVHNATLTLTKTDTGVSMSFSATDDTATLRTFDSADAVSPFTAFDRFSLTVWGNTVNYNLDNVVVTSNVPEPSSPLPSAAALLARRSRSRSRGLCRH